MVVMFVGHGNPMNAITDNNYASGWRAMVKDVPRPEAILCVSAHWDTRGLRVNTSPKPETIHDFWGFPRELYEVVYPCPGAPDRAHETARLVTLTSVHADNLRGLDHGTWAVIKWMYPQADVPVFQISIDSSKPASFHYEIGRQLRPLRDRGVLVVGSGNMVHNLSVMDMTEGAPPYEWAVEYDRLINAYIMDGEHGKLIDYDNLGPSSHMAIPTPEHYLPLITVLGASDQGEPLEFYNEFIDLRSVSMTSLKIGE